MTIETVWCHRLLKIVVFHYSLFWATIMLILWLTENMSCIRACRFMLLLLWLKKMFLNVYHIWVVVIVRTDYMYLPSGWRSIKWSPATPQISFYVEKECWRSRKGMLCLYGKWPKSYTIHAVIVKLCFSLIDYLFMHLHIISKLYWLHVISWCGKMLLVM